MNNLYLKSIIISAAIFLFMLKSDNLLAIAYQPVYSGYRGYFIDNSKSSNPDSIIFGVKVDRTILDKDSIFYLNHNIDYHKDSCCIVSDGNNWLGEKIIVSNDGKAFFFNKANDSIFVWLSGCVGDKWLAAVIADTIYLHAEVISIELESFLGLEDSVKTFQFSVKDENGEELSKYWFWENTLKISKNYGLVKALPFNIWSLKPFIQTFSYPSFNNFILCGLENEGVGIKDINICDIFDFQPGDEIHHYKFNIINNTDENYYKDIREYFIDKYISRTDYPDSIVYRIHRLSRRDILLNRDSLLHRYFDLVLDTTIIKESNLNTFVGQAAYETGYLGEGEEYMFSYFLELKNSFLAKSICYYDIYPLLRDSCWGEIILDGGIYRYSYYKGLGGPYWSASDMFAIHINSSDITYFKKNGVEWGEPVDIGSTVADNADYEIVVSPVPAYDFLTVELPYWATDNKNLEIFDLHGNLIISQALRNTIENIDISKIPAGVYYLVIQAKNYRNSFRKMIIKY